MSRDRARRRMSVGLPIVMTLAMTLAIILTGACSSSTPSPSCRNDYPATCPDGAATFAAEVLPLMQRRCVYCHDQAPRQLLTSYAEIRDAAHVVLMQLTNCTMPPAPNAPLTTEERRVLLSWFACGAMND